MTLSRKIAGTLSALVALVALVGAAAVWGLAGLNRNLGEALDEYAQLRAIIEVGEPVVMARASLDADAPHFARAAGLLDRASMKLRLLDPMDEPHLTAIASESADALDKLSRVLANQQDTSQLPAANDQLNQVLNGIRRLAEGTRQNIDRIQRAGRTRLWQTTVTIGVLAGVTVLVAIAIGLGQYRSVMRPVRRIGRAAERLAGGDFDQRIEGGDDELGALAQQFNRMADELQSLYTDMERRIEETSRQLVRSERLASVGYLAAGVAHEINNPLGIIAGQAELAQRRAEREGDEHTAGSLKAISEEAFRCKQITERLLALSRGGTETRQPVDLVAVVSDTLGLIADLPSVADRRIDLIQPVGPHLVHADATQMKQVVLNLLTNAVHATDPKRGEVAVEISRSGSTIALTVTDNGRGLDAAALQRVFEPFYTERRGGAEPGTGLGLSITHAIVTEHGGTIRVTSPGAGLGTRFIVELPSSGPASEAAT